MGLRDAWRKTVDDTKDGIRSTRDDVVGARNRAVAALEESTATTKEASADLVRLRTREGREAARLEKRRRREAIEEVERQRSAAMNAAFGRAAVAAERADLAAEEIAIAEAKAAVGGLTPQFQAELSRLMLEGTLRRSEFLGSISDMHFWRDRVITREGWRALDEHCRAQVDVAGNINTTYRSTAVRPLGVSAIGINPIHGHAFQKREHHDFRELYFILEHPEWSRAELVPPGHGQLARKIAAAVNSTAKACASETRPPLRRSSPTIRWTACASSETFVMRDSSPTRSLPSRRRGFCSRLRRSREPRRPTGDGNQVTAVSSARSASAVMPSRVSAEA